MSNGDYFIAVHGGAGYHHPDHDQRTKKALRSACRKALESLPTESGTGGDGSLAMVERAVVSLEDDPYLNAGYGSNLTWDGTVECDAAIFSAGNSLSGLFGSVGAMSGVKNPVSAARSVLEYSQKQDNSGRVPPMTLVSHGAVDFVRKHAPKLAVIPPESMVSTAAKEAWEKWKSRVEWPGAIDTEILVTEVDKDSLLQDTVGAVAWDSRGSGLTAGVSSGGLLLKFPGRVGEAAIFGAGCWAQHHSKGLDGVACSISGTGEEIVRSNLARMIGETYTPDSDPNELLQSVLVDRFWEPARERGVNNPAAGILMITTETDDGGRGIARVWCGFTTASMAIGFASSREPRPKV